MKTVTLSICCHSEAQDATVGFGVSFDADKANIYTIGTEWVSEGMLESFWENHFEFEAGIEKAKKLYVDCKDLTFRKALFSVFGYFSVSYEIDGAETELDLGIDINEAMYDMLETL